MKLSAQPDCSTSLADKASKQQGIRWQVSCSSKFRSCSAGPALWGTVCDQSWVWLTIFNDQRLSNRLSDR